jgi:hypothetical protein
MVEDLNFTTFLVLVAVAIVGGVLLGAAWHNVSHWRR